MDFRIAFPTCLNDMGVLCNLERVMNGIDDVYCMNVYLNAVRATGKLIDMMVSDVNHGWPVIPGGDV